VTGAGAVASGQVASPDVNDVFGWAAGDARSRALDCSSLHRIEYIERDRTFSCRAAYTAPRTFSRIWRPGDRRKTTMTDRIGDFLVKIGAMKPFQVQDILRVQQAGDKRLFGEIAIELRYINDDALKRYVDYSEKQKGEP
jgi:hypothetical protein